MMHRFENVDICATMDAIRKTLEPDDYKTTVLVDRPAMQRKFESVDERDIIVLQNFYIAVNFRESAFLNAEAHGLGAANMFLEWANGHSLAYAVNMKSMDGGVIRGDIHQLDLTFLLDLIQNIQQLGGATAEQVQQVSKAMNKLMGEWKGATVPSTVENFAADFAVRRKKSLLGQLESNKTKAAVQPTKAKGKKKEEQSL